MGKPIVIAGEFDAKGVATGVNQANGHLGRLSKTAGTVGRAVGKGMAVATIAVIGLGVATVGAASDAQQSIGATESVYGKYADSVVAESKRAADAVGLSSNAYRESSNQLGAMLKNSGTPIKKLGTQTKTLVGLASDLAATFGGETSEAVQAIGSLMRGEADPIERYGVSIKQSDINARLAAQGLKGLTGSALKQAEAQARLTLLFDQTSAAQGQFGRESATFAGQQQRLTANTENLKATIGTSLLPVLTIMASTLNTKVLPPVQAFAEKHGPELADKMTALGHAVSPLANGLFDRMGDGIASLNSGASGADLSSLGDSLAKIAPVVRDAMGALPGFTDVLNVSASVMAFAADHTDLLAKVLPLLVVGYAGVKAAQLAANVAAVVSLPTKIAEVVVNRQLVASNRQLIASRVGSTAATTTQTAAEKVGMLTRARAAVGMLAQRGAMVITAAATGIWTAAQWALNAALTANPIGLVIVGLVALGVGLGVLWAKSETFRGIVTGAFSAVGNVIGTVVGFVKAHLKTIGLVLLALTGPVGIVAALVIGNFGRIRSAASSLAGAVTGAVGKVTSTVSSIKGKITSAVSGFPTLLKDAGAKLIGGLIKGIESKIKDVGGAVGKVAGKIKGFLPGSPVKEGPLTSWNNGGAGKRLMDQGLIAGVKSRLGAVKAALSATAGTVADALMPTALTPLSATAPITNHASGSYQRAGTTGNTYQLKVEVTDSMSPVEIGRKMSKAIKEFERTQGAGR